MGQAIPLAQKRPLILVIDDDPDLLQLFHDVLTEECDYVVTPRPDQAPSLDEIRCLAPNVMIIDHRLARGVLGWDVVRELRAADDLIHLPILFCTADRQHLALVADDLTALRVTPLVKPFSVDQLVGDVAEALQLQGIDPSPCP
ncbi:MAG: response regulator [Herpetosiphonaceae bacterium]|nr:response regulator [Herpetosiphonaceae bacterium]